MGIQKIGLTLALSLVQVCAYAWDNVSAVPANLPGDFVPSLIAPPDANGFWTYGYEGNQPLLVRYSTAGVPKYVRYPQNHFQDSYDQFAAGADGSVVFGFVDGFSTPHCVLRRYDASGSLRWVNEAPEQPDGSFPNANCDPFQLDGAGGAWIRGSNIYRLATDGAIDTTVAYGGLQLNGILADPAAANVYLFGATTGAGSSASRAVVEKFSSRGAMIWKWQAPSADGNTAITNLLVAGDGNLYGIGSVSGANSSTALYSARISPSGQAAWTHTFTDVAVNLIDEATALPAGGTFVLLNQPTAAGGDEQLLKIDAQGNLAWTRSVGASSNNGCIGKHLRSSFGGDAIVASDCQSDSSGNAFGLMRFDGAGNRLFSTTFDSSWFGDLQILADQTSLLVAYHNATDTGSGIISVPPSFLHHARDGSNATPPQTTSVVGAADSLAASTFDSDGSAYVLSTISSNGYALSRVTPDGSVRWRFQGNGNWGYPYNRVKVVVAGDAVCLVGIRDPNEIVECHATSDGAMRGQAQFGPGVSAFDAGDVTYARGLSNGEVVILFSYAAGFDLETDHVLLKSDGTVLHQVLALNPNEYNGGVSINAAGESLAIAGPQKFARFALDGTRTFTGTLDADAGSINQAYLADDGSGLLLSQSADKVQLTRIDATGAKVWTQTLLSSSSQLLHQYSASIQKSGNDLYLALGYAGLVFTDDDSPLQVSYLLYKIGMTDGGVQWTGSFPGLLFSFPQLRPDATDLHLLAVSGWPNKLHTQLLDARTGALLDDRFEDCANENCALSASGVGSDGALRIVADTSGDGSGNQRRVFERLRPFDAPAPIHIAQPGIDGAWFAPYASGQGFTLDYIAGANTLFMPWFTFSPNGTNSPLGLNWFALQGTADANSTGADLAITAADPGAFDSGTVGVRQVGSAHLSFRDCNAGTLSYHFNPDVNAGAAGTISLTRLTPSVSHCVLADGSIVPAQNVTSSTLGFDASQSGSWFDPGTSGQGLEISVVPPSPGSDGLLFAAWFTFDPASKSDEVTHQHWFTLQGSLAAANAGKVTLPILRTIGGSLDAIATGNTVQVGHAALTIMSCDSAQLDYQFDASDVAHAFAGLSGSIALTKIGGCTAQ